MIGRLIDWLHKRYGSQQPLIKHIEVDVSRTYRLVLNGHDGYLIRTSLSGVKAVIGGWTSAYLKWREGDYLILVKGTLTTRYKIDKIVRSKHAQYFVECTFAPRGQPFHDCSWMA